MSLWNCSLRALLYALSLSAFLELCGGLDLGLFSLEKTVLPIGGLLKSVQAVCIVWWVPTPPLLGLFFTVLLHVEQTNSHWMWITLDYTNEAAGSVCIIML